MAQTYGFRAAQLPPSVTTANYPLATGGGFINFSCDTTADKIVGLTFKSSDYDEEISAIIDNDPLTQDSTMKEVMNEFNIIDDLSIVDIKRCRFFV